MKKILFLGIFLLTLNTIFPSFASAVDRNTLVAGARASVVLSSVFNTNVVVINLSANGSQTNGGPIPQNAATTIQQALAKLKTLKAQLRNQ